MEAINILYKYNNNHEIKPTTTKPLFALFYSNIATIEQQVQVNLSCYIKLDD